MTFFATGMAQNIVRIGANTHMHIALTFAHRALLRNRCLIKAYQERRSHTVELPQYHYCQLYKCLLQMI